MSRSILIAAMQALGLLVPLAATAAPVVDQYATKVLGFSSQYSTDRFSAKQATKAPDTLSYGDISTAWAPSTADAGAEYISLGYATPVYATGATIHETDGYGFVTSVDAIDTAGVAHTVWQGTDDGLPNQINNLEVSWAQTPYVVTGLTIHTNTALHASWEEIDAVALHGVQPLAGTVTPLLGHTMSVVCTNTTTKQTLTITAKGSGKAGAVTQWDCQSAGLKFSVGDVVTMQIKGTIAP